MSADLPPPAVGVLGGTFDPVHIGHLALAESIRCVLRLSQMLLVPTARPPHKPEAILAPIADRIAMIELALGEHPRLCWSAVESDPETVCYTIDTLRSLRVGPPARRPIFCVGGDALPQLHTWHDWRSMIEEFDLAVVDRGEADRVDSRSLDPQLSTRLVEIGQRSDPAPLDPGRGGRVFLVAMTPIPVSSSQIRARVVAGQPIEDLVPPAVARYILGAKLYRSGDRR